MAILQVGLFAAGAFAQTQVLVFDTLFEAQNLSQWGTGAASGANYSVNLGTSWNESTSFGGFSTGFFGDEWGAGGTASTSGNVGFNASLSTQGGSVDVYIPNRIRVETSKNPTIAQPTITITQDRGGLGANNLFQADFASINFALGFHAAIDARVEGRVAYGVGSASGAITLRDLFAATNPTLYAASRATGLDPFNFNVNLLQFDGNTATLTLAGQSLHVPNGLNKNITTKDVIPLNNAKDKLPVENRVGSVHINPALNQLNVQSGASLSTTATETQVFGASIDALGLVTAAFGLPVNPFDLRANIPSTPIGIELMALSISPHLDLGLQQTLSLSPRTYLTLTSNYNVTYRINGGTVTTKNLHYLLPDDASLASSLQILSRPAEADWQLFSSIYADPQLHNQLYLTITGGIDIEALKARLSAYGAGVSLGPLFDFDPSYTQKILISDQLVGLTGGTLSRVYRNPTPLFGSGALRNLQLDLPTDAILLLSQSGVFGLTELAGQLTVRDSFFSNTTPITLDGRLHLDVSPSPLAVNPHNPSANQFETPSLTVTPTGTLKIDPNSLLVVTGLKDANDAFVLDGFNNHQLGFITGTGYDQGTIDSGTFLLGGTLDYDGAWITRIGADAHIELLPSAFDAGAGTYPDLGRRFNNYRGASTSAEAVDGLSRLDTLAGTLVVAGQDLNLVGNLTHSGNLSITHGHTFTAGTLTNTATGRITVAPNSLATFAGLSAANLDGATRTLANLNLFLGGETDTTAGIFRYRGNLPTALASSSDFTLSGRRPASGYFQGGAKGDTDALASIAANAGSLRLQNGATQTVGGTQGGLNNTGALAVVGTGSALTVSGPFANTGTLSLVNQGALTATGTLTNLGGGGVLTGGVWDLGGRLAYTGPGITAIANGTTVNLIDSGGITNGGNALASFATLDGSLALSDGASAATTVALTTNGTLDLAAGTLFTTGGFNLHGTLNLAGTLRQTGPAVTTLAADSRVNVRGAGALQTAGGDNGWAGLTTNLGVLDLASGGTVHTDSDLTLAGGSRLILGAGGVLQAAGSALVLADPAALVQNGGRLILGGNTGVTTTWALPDAFSFDHFTLQLGNGGDTTGALTATTGWTNTADNTVYGAGSLSGGTIVNHGSLLAVGGTLTLSGFTDPLVNAGQFGSYTDWRGRGDLVLDNVTLDNHAGPASGIINARAGLTLLDGTAITGGRIDLYEGGTLTAGNVTLELGDFDAANNRTTLGTLALDGAMTVLADKTVHVTADTIIGRSGSLTLEGEINALAAAHLAFGTDSSFRNLGTVNLGSGSAITGAQLDNFGTVNLTSGLVHLDHMANGTGGTVNLLDGSTLNFDVATFDNAGLIHLSGENPATVPNSSSTFLLTQDLILTGGGTLQLGGYNTSTAPDPDNVNLATIIWANAGSGNLIGDGSAAHVLTLENQQLIGRGDFGQGTLSLINRVDSSIGVYGAGSILNIETDAGGFLNEGALNVDVGSTLNIFGGPFLSLDADGYLVKGTYRVGGTLVIPGLTAGAFDSRVALTFKGSDARIQNENGETIQIRNNLAGGALTVADGAYTFATDATHPFTNQGLLQAAGGGTLAITGGHFTNYNAATHTLAGGSYESAGVFKFDGADIRTLAANTQLTLRKTNAGTGTFTDENGQNALRQFATNHGGFSLQGGANHTFDPSLTAFTNDGRMRVGTGSTLNLNQAALTPTANSDWWIGGTVTGGSGFTTTGKVTLFGPSASIQSPGYSMDDGTKYTIAVDGPWTTYNSPEVTNEGHLVFAGGITATYSNGGMIPGTNFPFGSGATIHNHGIWEIGSPSVLDASGKLIRSAASVNFVGGGADDYAAARIFNDSGAIFRYYGAVGDEDGARSYGAPVSDDATTGRFNLDHLRIQGGTFDANGLITVNAGGTFALRDALLRTSQGKLTVRFDTPGSVFNISGGLDLIHPLDVVNGTINYSHSGNLPVGITGFDLYLPGYNYAQADYALRSGARFIDAAGLSALRHIQTNWHTVTFDHANGIAGNAHTYDLEFTNYGTIDNIASNVSFGADLINRGALHTSQYGQFVVRGNFDNHATVTGRVDVAGNLNHYAGALSASGSVGGNLYLSHNSTVPHDADGYSEAQGLTVGGRVENYTDLFISGPAFRRGQDYSFAPIYNYGRLNLSSYIDNDLIQQSHSSDGIHTTGDTSLGGNNTKLAGSIYVDQGSLSAASASSFGTATLHLANDTALNLGASTGTNAVNATGDVRLHGTGGGIGDFYGSTTQTGTLTTFGTLSLSANTLNAVAIDGDLTVKAGSFLFLNGPVTGYYPGSGNLTFYGDARPFGGNGGGVSVRSDLDIHQFNLRTATGTPTLYLSGTPENRLTANIDNPGLTQIMPGANLTLQGSLSGNGRLQIGNASGADSTSLTLVRPATVSDITIHSRATLTLEPGYANQPPLSANIANYGTLHFASDYDYALTARAATGDGAYIKSGAGTLTLPDLSYLQSSQPFAINAGTLLVGNGSLYQSGWAQAGVATNATLALQNAGHTTLSLHGTGRFDNLGSGFTTVGLSGGFSSVNHYGSGTLNLPANSAIDGPVNVGRYLGFAYPGFTNTDGGTLLIADDTSLGAAPETYAPGWLRLDGATLGVDGNVTLAATRGVQIGSRGATFDVNRSLTIPAALEGVGYGRTHIAKTGGGTLTIGAAPFFDYAVEMGTLQFNNHDSVTGIGASVNQYATLQLSGGGSYRVTAGSQGIDGRILVDAGANLEMSGKIDQGELIVHGTLSTTESPSISAISGTGTYAYYGYNNPVTIGSLTIDRLTVEGSGLVINHLNVDHVALDGALQIDSGTIHNLDVGFGTIIANAGKGIYIHGVTASGGSSLTFNGEGTLLFEQAGTIPTAITANAGTLVAYDGTVFSQAISGAGRFDAINGVVTLGANNTYTGGTTVESSELMLGQGGSTGAVLGTINFNSSLGGLAFNRSDTYTFANTLSDRYTPSPAIDAAYLRQAGTGTLVLNSDFAWTDPESSLTGVRPVIVSRGTLRLDDGVAGLGTITNEGGALVFNNTAPLTLAQAINITGAGIVTQAGSGTTTLGGFNDWTGATSINAGTLVLTTPFANSGGITVASGTTLELAGTATLGGAVANAGTVSLNRGADDFMLDATLTGSGTLRQNGTGRALLASGNASRLDLAAGSLGFFTNYGATHTFTGEMSGPGTFFHSGLGTLVLTGGTGMSSLGSLHAEQGTLRLDAGTWNAPIAIDSGASLAIGGAIDFARTISGPGQLRVENGGTLNLTGTVAPGLYGTTIASGGRLNLLDTSVYQGGAIVNHGLLQFSYTHDLTFAPNTSGTGDLLLSNPIRLIFTGQHTGAGTTTIAAGSTLALADGATVAGTVANAGNFEIITTPGSARLIPANIVGPGDVTFSGGGTAEVLAAGLGYDGRTILTEGTTLGLYTHEDITTTFDRSILGYDGNLLKSGPGTLVLSASNHFDHITVAEGTLQIGDGLSAGGFIAYNDLLINGTLAFNGTTATGIATARGMGGIHQMGSGFVTISGDNPNLLGDTTVDAGRLLILGNESGTAGSVGGKLVAEGTLWLRRSGAFTVDQGLTGSGTVTKTLAGDLHLGGDLNFTGQLTVEDGALITDARAGSRLDRVSATSLTNLVTGNLILTGDNSLDVTNAGWLTLGDGGTTGSLSRNTITNSGILVFNRSDDVSVGFANTVTGSGTIQQIGSGTLTIGMNASADYLGVNHGTMIIDYAFAGHPNLNVSAGPDGILQLIQNTYDYSIGVAGLLRANTGTGVITLNKANLTGGIELLGTGSLSLPNVVVMSLNQPLTGTADLTLGGNLLNLNAGSTHTGTIHLGHGAFGSVNVGGDLASAIQFATPGGIVNFTNTGPAHFTGSLANVAALNFNGTGSTFLQSAVAAPAILNAGLLSLATGGSLNTLVINHGTASINGGSLDHATLADAADAVLDASAADTTLASLAGGGSVVLGARTLTLNQSADTTYAGAIDGTGGLVKTGARSFILAGDNTFTGNVAVDDGALFLRGANTAARYRIGDGASLWLNAIANLGTAPATFQPDFITLQNGTLGTEAAVAFTPTQGITLDGGGTLVSTDTLTLNSQIAGNGPLTLDGDRVLFNAAHTYAGPVLVHGTLALGRADAITPANTSFAPGSTFDVNGFDWSAPLVAQGVTIANRAATGVTVSSALALTDNFGLAGPGPLHFTGTIDAPGGGGSVSLASDGNVRFDSASADLIGTLNVGSGNLSIDLDAIPHLAAINLAGTGRLTLTGTARDLAVPVTVDLPFDNGGDTVALLNNTQGALRWQVDLALTEHDNLRRSIVLIGGDSDLTLAGSLSGEASLTKIGAGNLTLESDVTGWDVANSGARLGVREGALITNVTTLHNRGLIVENTGRLILADDASANLEIRSLDGNGTLDLGDRNLVLNQATTGTFTGTVSTTGGIISNAANGSDWGVSGGTQTYGTLNAGSLTVNVGHIVVTDALNTDNIFVNTSAVGGYLTTTTNGLTANGGTALDTYINLAGGEMRLIGGVALTANQGTLSLAGAGSSLLDADGTTSTFSHFATNTGSIYLSSNAAVAGGAATFTNTDDGNVVLGRATWTGLHRVVNQTSLAGGFTVGQNSELEVTRFNQISGPLTLMAGGEIRGHAGQNATDNPAFVMTGGEFSAAGTLRGGSVFRGGVTQLGAFYTVGTLQAADGVVLDRGARFQWTFDSTDSANHSLLAVTAGTTNEGGVLTVTATPELPVLIDLYATGSTLSDFDPEQNRTWTFATTSDGLVGFDSDRFLVTPIDVYAGITGNFGLVAHGHNVDLVYDPSYVYDTSSGDLTVGASLAAKGRFGGLFKMGEGTLTLAAANAYTGYTALNEGTLVLGHDQALGTGALRVQGYDTVTLAGDGSPRSVANPVYLFNHLTLGGDSDLTFTGSLTNAVTQNRTVRVENTGATTLGDVVLSATSDAYTRTGRTLTMDIADTAGPTIIAGVISDGLLTGGRLTKSGGGALTLAAANTHTGATRIAEGTLAISSDANLGTAPASATPGQLTLDGGTLENTASFTLNPNRGVALGDAGGTFLTDTATTLTYDGIVAGSGALVKTGTGTLALNGANTYAGGTTINAGRLLLSADSALGSGALTLDGGGIKFGAPVTDLRGATLGSAGGAFDTNTFNATVSGGLTGAGSLTKNDPGVLALTGVNDYSGGTLVNGGAVQIDANARLGSGALTLDGGGIIFDATFSDFRGFTLGAGGGILNTNGFAVTVAQAISGGGDVTTNGPGTLTFDGANNYTGTTFVSAGTLRLGPSGTLGSGNGDLIVNGGTLDLGGQSIATGDVTLTDGTVIHGQLSGASYAAQSGTIDAILAGDGALTKTTSGTVTLSGDNRFSGGTTVADGTIIATAANALGTGPVSLTGGSLTLANDTDLAFSAAVSLATDSTLTVDRMTAGAASTLSLDALALGAQTLTLTAGAHVTAGTAGLTIGRTTLTASNAVFSPAAGTALTLGTLNGTATSLTFTGTGDATVNGVIATGTGALNKSGGGTLTLSGANTFTGGITADDGILRATRDIAALGAGNLTLSGGALSLANDTGLAFDRPTILTADARFTSDRLTSGEGVAHSLGSLSLGAQTLTLAQGANVTSGTAGLAFGATTLTGNATFSADHGTRLTLDHLSADGATTTTFTGAGNSVLTGVVALATGTLAQSGPGTLTLSGSGSQVGTLNVLDGTATLAGGSLTASNTSVDSGGTLVVSTGGSLVTSGSANALDHGGNFTITGSGSSWTNDRNFSVHAGNLSLLDHASASVGSLYLGLNQADIASATVSDGAQWNVTELKLGYSGQGTLTVSSGGRVTANALVLGDNAEGIGHLIVTGANSQVTTSQAKLSNLGTGIVDVLAGGALTNLAAAQLSSGNVGDTPGFPHIAVNVSGPGSTWTIDGPLDIGLYLDPNNHTTGALTVADGALVKVGATGTGTVSIDRGSSLFIGTGGLAGTLTSGPIANSGAIVFNHSDDLGFTSTITNLSAHPGALTKLGGGMLTLSGTNRYTGGTIFAGGTLALGSDAAIGDDGDLTFTGGTLQYTAGNVLDYSSRINHSTAAIAIDTNGRDVAYTSTLATSNTGGLTKSGTGTLTLAATNDYSGTTTVSGGLLQVIANAALGSGDLALNGGGLKFGAAFNNLRAFTIGTNGATLDTNGFDVTYRQSLADANALTKTGTGALTLAGTNTGFSGALTVTAGSLQLDSDARLGAGTLAIDGGGLKLTADVTDLRGFTIGANGANLDTSIFDVTVVQAISGDGSFTKIGPGTLTFAAANGYTGTTIISDGTLLLSPSGTLGAGGLTLNSGGILDLGGQNITTGTVTLAGGSLTGGTLAGASYDARSGNFSGALSGAGALTKNTSGTMILAGDNTGYTGTIAVNDGTLSVTHANALGAASAGTTVASGATLNLDAVYIGAESLTLGGTGIADAGALTGTGTAGLAGAIALASNTHIGSSGTLTLAGPIGESGGARTLTKVGPGTLILSGANTFSGLTILSTGTLRATTNAAALGRGPFRIDDGNLQLASDTGLAFGRDTLLNGTGLHTITSDRVTTGEGVTHSLGTLSLGTQTLALAKGGNVASGTAGLAFGATTLTGAATFAPAADTWLTLDSITGTDQSFTVNGAGHTTILGPIATGGGGLTKSGTGTLTLAGANTFTGAISLHAGTLSVASLSTATEASPLGQGSLLFGGGTLQYTGTGSSVSPFAMTINTGGGTLSVTQADSMLELNANLSGTNTGLLADALIKTGAGTLVLSGGDNPGLDLIVNAGTARLAKTNGSSGHAISGNLQVNAGGTVQLGGTGNDQIRDTAAVAVNAGGTFDFNGNNEAFNTLTGAGTLTNTSAISASTAIIGGADGSSTFSGVIADGTSQVMNLTKTGTGTLTLAGANTFTGTTMISAGTLTLGNSLALAGSTLEYSTGALSFGTLTNVTLGGLSGHQGLVLSNGNATAVALTVGENNASTSYTGTLSGAGSLTKTGTGTLTLGMTNHHTGGTTISAGILSIDGTAGSLSGDVLNHAALSFSRSNAYTFAGVISGTGSVIQSGPDTLTLSAANHYTGGTTIDNGYLSISTNANLGEAGGTVSLDGGTLVTTADITATRATTLGPSGGTFSAVAATTLQWNGDITGSGALRKVGDGTLQLGGNTTYTGDTAVRAGTLSVSGNLSSSPLTAVSGTGVLSGTGMVGGLSVAHGGTLAPGNSPGTLHAGHTTWGPSGHYLWEINDATGAAGANWDFLSVIGTLDLTALSSVEPFVISLVSLLPDNTPGALANFDATQNHAYSFVTASSGILGFEAANFSIDATGFAHDLASGVWSFVQIDHGLSLNFTAASAVPEPSTYAGLIGLGALGFALWRQRRRSRHRS